MATSPMIQTHLPKIGPQFCSRSNMDAAAIRPGRTTLSQLLSSNDPSKISPMANRRSAADTPGGRTRLFNVIREEESAGGTPPERERGRPMRVSLMTLLAIGDKSQVDESAAGDIAGSGMRLAEEEVALCSVCAVRRKGAAFIPCGHTFCRLCSRALSTGGRRCPVCNGGISGVLDIF